ncbi:MAG: hypothetical protein EA347_06165 [Thioalkalivibrio sp.]|nr:MAG: hypothetical protein EA347_06165 [Thioalkalivibrio sp.]
MTRNRDFKKDPSTEFKDLDDLRKHEAKDEIDALREGIEFHDHRYTDRRAQCLPQPRFTAFS